MFLKHLKRSFSLSIFSSKGPLYIKNYFSQQIKHEQTPLKNQDIKEKSDTKQSLTGEFQNADLLPQLSEGANKISNKSTKDPLFPSFSQLDQSILKAHTSYSIENQIYSPFRWTPLIQKIKPSNRFHEEMYKFSKVRQWEFRNTKELIDCFLFEALQGTDFDYYYDYKCLPSKYCKFHGIADFLIYNKNEGHIPFIPVLVTQKKHNAIINEKFENFDVAPAVGAGIWSITNMLAIDGKTEYSRVLKTSGHKWILCQIQKDGEFKKTGIYEPHDQGPYKKIFRDPNMQEVILGLIRFSCGIQSENEKALEQAYNLIDDLKYMTDLDPETKKKLEERNNTWKFIPKSIRKIFFDS